MLVVWDVQGRPYFECGRCSRRAKHIYLDELVCRRCAGLDYASRHLHRSVPMSTAEPDNQTCLRWLRIDVPAHLPQLCRKTMLGGYAVKAEKLSQINVSNYQTVRTSLPTVRRRRRSRQLQDVRIRHQLMRRAQIAAMADVNGLR